MNTTPGQIAARAVNAHPWLSAITPDVDDADTDLIIVPPYPADYLDRPTGYVEGRITWNTTSTGTVAYLIALAYEGPNGTVEEQTTFEVDLLAPLVWLDLARPIATVMDRLHALAHSPVEEAV